MFLHSLFLSLSLSLSVSLTLSLSLSLSLFHLLMCTLGEIQFRQFRKWFGSIKHDLPIFNDISVCGSKDVVFRLGRPVPYCVGLLTFTK